MASSRCSSGKLLLGRLAQLVVRLDVLGQFVAPAAKTVELRGNRGDLPVEVRDAAAAPVAGGRGARDLVFQAADLVAQHADGPHLFELGRAMLLVLAAHLVQPRHEFREGPLALDQPLRDLAMQFFGGFDRLGRFPATAAASRRPGR